MRGKYNYCLDNNISYSETIESIAKNMNASMATVKTAINELTSSGILKVIKDRSAYNKNTYVFLTEGVDNAYRCCRIQHIAEQQSSA